MLLLLLCWRGDAVVAMLIMLAYATSLSITASEPGFSLAPNCSLWFFYSSAPSNW